MAEYIEREALLEALNSDILNDEGCPMFVAATVEQIVSMAPAADVEPVRHGQWDGESDGYAETADGEMAPVVDVWYCSECGHCIDEGIDDETLLPNYCPHCGAHMDEVNDAPNEEAIQYEWPETGTLEVAVKSPNMATLRFKPSEDAIKACAQSEDET